MGAYIIMSLSLDKESNDLNIDKILYELKKYTTSRPLDDTVLVHYEDYDFLTENIFDKDANIFVNRHVYSANTNLSRLHRHNFLR